MFFTHLPDMPEGMSPEQITQANEWLQTNVDSEMWTSAAVCKHFKFSGARLNQLNKEHVIPGHIKFGATHVYLMRFAGPWFAAYKKRSDVRKVKVEAPKKKAGRPKKEGNEEWRDTHLGEWHIVIGPEYESAKSWFNHMSDRMSRELPLNSPERAQWLETREALRAHFGIRAGL
jgi:hypothetical protein